LLPAEVRRAFYALAEINAKSIYLSLFGWRGIKFIKYFKGGASYNILVISSVVPLRLRSLLESLKGISPQVLIR
jgi:hypothetical protein